MLSVSDFVVDGLRGLGQVFDVPELGLDFLFADSFECALVVPYSHSVSVVILSEFVHCLLWHSFVIRFQHITEDLLPHLVLGFLFESLLILICSPI